MEKTSELKQISRGATFEHIISGFILMALSVFLIYSGFYPAIIFLYFGFCLFISVQGTIIDIKNNQIKVYLNFFVFKIGKWQSLVNFQQLILTYFSQSQTMNYKSISSNVNTRTFDIYLEDNQLNKIYLKEISEYKKARMFIEEMSKFLAVEFTDKYEAMRNSISKRNRR